MKYLLLFLLLSLPAFGANITWRSPATSVQIKAPAMPTGGGYIYGRIYVNGAERSGIGVSQVVASGQTVTINVSAQSITADEADSVRILFYYDANNSPTNVNVFWLQMSKLQPPISAGGPFNSEGQPVDANGDPVDDQGKPIVAPPKRHYASAEYTNSNPFPVTLQIIYTCSTEGLIYQTAANVESGSRYFQDGYHDHPFSITMQPMADGNPLGDPITGDSEPVDEDDPGLPPLPGPGEPGGEGGPPSTGGGPRPGTGQVGTPEPTPNQPRPGAGDGNDEARHKELRGELQRIVAQINSAANQAAGDADRTNDLLNGIKDNTGKTAENTEGDGDGGEGGEGGEGDGPGMGPGIGEATDSLGIADKLNGIKQAGAGTMTALGNMVATLNLQGQYSSGDWSFQIPFGPFGVIDIDFADLPGWIFPTIRQILLFVMGMGFVGKFISAFKGAFS